MRWVMGDGCMNYNKGVMCVVCVAVTGRNQSY